MEQEAGAFWGRGLSHCSGMLCHDEKAGGRRFVDGALPVFRAGVIVASASGKAAFCGASLDEIKPVSLCRALHHRPVCE